MKRIFAAFFLFVFSFSVFAEESKNTDKNWDDVKFPQWSLDLRRTEIITLGSLPFVTMWTALGYSLSTYGEFRNPLDRSAGSFTEDDQKKVVTISFGICAVLGLVDLAITLISRHTKKEKKIEEISVEPLPKAVENFFDKTNGREYLIDGVIESAVF